MSLFYKISIDRFSREYMSGWCFRRLGKHETVSMELIQGSRLLGKVQADRFREDILELGIHPTGNCGFELLIKEPLSQDTGDQIYLKDSDSGRIIEAFDPATLKNFSGKTFVSRALLGVKKGLAAKKTTIVFMHIPKTAGTSFNTQIRTLMPNESAISHIEALEEEKYPELRLNYRFISGHLNYGILKKYFETDRSTFYTIVREPYAHLHSHLKWVIRSAEGGEKNTLKFRNRTIYELGEKLSSVDFGNIRELRAFVDTIQGVDAAFFDNMQVRHFLDDRVEMVMAEDLEKAIENSRDFAFVGLTERYPEFLTRFAEHNDLKLPVQTSVLNKSRSSSLFDVTDPQIREILYPLIRYDLKLYEHIRGLFS